MDQRQIRLLRLLVNVALLSLIAGAILNLLESVFGTIYSFALGLGTVVVTLYCFYRADQQISASREYYLWRYIPTGLFVMLPILLYVLSAWESNWSLQALYMLLSLTANYLLPIACMLYIERCLKRATL